MRQRLLVPFLLLILLSLPLLGGALPAGADLPPPLDALVKHVLPDDPSPVPGAVKISAGGDHTCAVTRAGDAYCWGRNDYGQLGDGTTTNRTTPVKVLPGAGLTSGTIADITVGGYHTCARTSTGDAYCWGANDSGRLGDGTTTDRTTPVMVHAGAGLAPGTIADVAAGHDHTCASTSTGDAYCWGYNGFGRLGDGTTTTRTTPVKVSAGAGLASGTVANITGGGSHTCAGTTTGDAYCWGRNNAGWLGDGTTTDRTTPVKVLPGAGLASGTVANITARSSHTCARTTTGDAYCWGWNGFGQLGDGSITTSTTPVKVSSGAGLTSGTVAAISAGMSHTCARTTTGDAYCWGNNADGQLGDSTTTNRSMPVKVFSGAGLASGTVADIAAGERHSCARTTTGDAYCWGYNTYGQLGDGTTSSSSTPVKVVPMIVTPNHCDDDATRIDKVDWSNGANEFSVDIHEKDDGYVYTCVYAERNGEVLLDEVVRVSGDVITVDDNAPPGNGPDSPCTQDHGEGGTSTNRAYVRSTPTDTWPAQVCAGIISGAGNKHVRITVG